MLDSRNSGGAHTSSRAGRRGVDVDQNFGASNTINGTQRFFRIVLDRRWNIWIVRRESELHFDFAIVDIDRLDQTKRNDVASEAAIFNRLQHVHRLFL